MFRMHEMPKQLKVQYMYSGIYAISTVGVPSNVAYKIVRVNSVYDPDYSGAGE